jgi:hypothetical protein
MNIMMNNCKLNGLIENNSVTSSKNIFIAKCYKKGTFLYVLPDFYEAADSVSAFTGEKWCACIRTATC